MGKKVIELTTGAILLPRQGVVSVRLQCPGVEVVLVVVDGVVVFEDEDTCSVLLRGQQRND